MTRYDKEIENQIRLYFGQLSEKDKRHYAALECQKLGYGSKTYICNLLGISRSCIDRGIAELTNEEIYAQIPIGKQRRVGGGRKKKEVTHPDLISQLSELIDRHKAGSPTDPSVYWIHLKPKEISLLFEEQYQIKVSNGLVKRVLKSLGYRYRKLSKTLATGEFKEREKQFSIICNLVLAVSLDTPILSIDCKNKEEVGNLYRDEKCYATDAVEVFDHDYQNLSQGKVIPHGIYDLQRNEGYISIGSSTESAEFIADNLLWWWDNFGIHYYWNAPCILIFCDAGGGNSYRHHAFKKQMLNLARMIGKDIIICHYPPYCSKYNPIEHRLFCHVHRAMQGVVFSNYQLVKELISKTTTKTGLKVKVRLNLKAYQKGIKTAKEQVDFQRIQFNSDLPKLSYRIAA